MDLRSEPAGFVVRPDGRKVAYIIDGDLKTAANVFVCFHGMFSNASFFKNGAPEGSAFVSIDRMGYGKSSYVSPEKFSYQDMVDDAKAIIDKFPHQNLRHGALRGRPQRLDSGRRACPARFQNRGPRCWHPGRRNRVHRGRRPTSTGEHQVFHGNLRRGVLHSRYGRRGFPKSRHCLQPLCDHTSFIQRKYFLLLVTYLLLVTFISIVVN